MFVLLSTTESNQPHVWTSTTSVNPMKTVPIWAARVSRLGTCVVTSAKLTRNRCRVRGANTPPLAAITSRVVTSPGTDSRTRTDLSVTPARPTLRDNSRQTLPGWDPATRRRSPLNKLGLPAKYRGTSFRTPRRERQNWNINPVFPSTMFRACVA